MLNAVWAGDGGSDGNVGDLDCRAENAQPQTNLDLDGQARARRDTPLLEQGEDTVDGLVVGLASKRDAACQHWESPEHSLHVDWEGELREGIALELCIVADTLAELKVVAIGSDNSLDALKVGIEPVGVGDAAR